jgi:hypothetical protein
MKKGKLHNQKLHNLYSSQHIVTNVRTLVVPPTLKNQLAAGRGFQMVHVHYEQNHPETCTGILMAREAVCN